MNIFIHGWSFSKDIWKDYFYLNNSYFFDIPFHGNFQNFSKKNIISSYIDYLNYKIKKPFTFIGWSLGATICVMFALKYPEKVKKLILVGFSPKFKDKRLGHNPVAVKAFMIALKADFKHTIYKFRKSATGSEFPKIPLPEKNGSIKLLYEFINLDLTDKLNNISAETYFIHGKEDKIINYHGSVFASRKIKTSKLILTQSNHAPFLQEKNLILDLL